MTSNRKKQWDVFSEMVGNHIEEYTVPQYGDWPDDQLEKFTVHDILTNMKRYINRGESNQRGWEDGILDCLKLAHYSCALFLKKGTSKKEEEE